MGEEEQLDLGSIAVAHGLLAPEALRECREDLRLMHARGLKLTLGEILVSKGLVDREDVVKLQKLKSALGGESKKIGPFELLAKIGEGGMGAVYKVRDARTGQIAALKILPATLAENKEFVQRFKGEARILKSLSHPNIVRALDFGQLDYARRELHYMSMELVEGETLMKRIERGGAVKGRQAFDWLADIARALQHAHHNELVHRDIKPENIFITKDGYAKLGDFGLALEVADEATRITRTGIFMGSVHYSSPEQAEGLKDIDIRSDIYSLGATYYHAFTGEVPFEGTSAADVLVMHLTEELPWPGDVNPRVSDAASELIAKMMAKKREERFQAPMELLHALDDLMSQRGGTRFLRSSAASSIARSKEKRARVLTEQKRRRQKREKAARPSARTHPRVLLAAAGAAMVLAAAVAVVVIALGGREKKAPRAEEGRIRLVTKTEPPPAPRPRAAETEPVKAVRPAQEERIETVPPAEVPPGAKVLYRESFDLGPGLWECPTPAGVDERPQAVAIEGVPGLVLRLPQLTAHARFDLGAAAPFYRRKLHGNAPAFSFAYRTKGRVSEGRVQILAESPTGAQAGASCALVPSPAWTRRTVAFQEFSPKVECTRLLDVKVYWRGPPGECACYIDDFVIYEPERPISGLAAPQPPRPAAEEWIATFNGRDLAGWRALSEGARVRDGALVAEGGSDLYYPASWSEFVLECELMSVGGTTEGAAVVGLAQAQPGRGNSRVQVKFHRQGDIHIYAGSKFLWRSPPRCYPPDAWVSARLELARGGLRIHVGDKMVGNVGVANVPMKAGGLYFFGNFGATAMMRNARVRVLSPEPSGALPRDEAPRAAEGPAPLPGPPARVELIAGFEGEPELRMFERLNELADVERVEEHATQGDYSLRVAPVERGFARMSAGDWLGLTKDWSWADRLCLDVYVAEGAPVPMTIEIRDNIRGAEYPTRKDVPVVLVRGHNPIEVRLNGLLANDGRSRIVLSDVKQFALHFSKGGPFVVFVDNIRLERDEAGERLPARSPGTEYLSLFQRCEGFPVPGGTGRLHNPSFEGWTTEGVPTGWGVNRFTSLGYRIEDRDVHDGNRCLRVIDRSTTIQGKVFQQVAGGQGLGGKKVRFSAWVKLLEGKEFVDYICIHTPEAGYVYNDDPPVRRGEWRELSVEAKLPETVSTVGVYVCCFSDPNTGEMLVDDARFEVLDDPAAARPVAAEGGEAPAGFRKVVILREDFESGRAGVFVGSMAYSEPPSVVADPQGEGKVIKLGRLAANTSFEYACERVPTLQVSPGTLVSFRYLSPVGHLKFHAAMEDSNGKAESLAKFLPATRTWSRCEFGLRELGPGRLVDREKLVAMSYVHFFAGTPGVRDEVYVDDVEVCDLVPKAPGGPAEEEAAKRRADDGQRRMGPQASADFARAVKPALDSLARLDFAGARDALSRALPSARGPAHEKAIARVLSDVDLAERALRSLPGRFRRGGPLSVTWSQRTENIGAMDGKGVSIVQKVRGSRTALAVPWRSVPSETFCQVLVRLADWKDGDYLVGAGLLSAAGGQKGAARRFLDSAAKKGRDVSHYDGLTRRAEAPVKPTEEAPAEKPEPEQWAKVFNGRDLEGWETDSPKGRVEGGALVSSGGACLFRPGDWEDFALQCRLSGGNAPGAVLGIGLAAENGGRSARIVATFSSDGSCELASARGVLGRTRAGVFSIEQGADVSFVVRRGIVRLYRGGELASSINLMTVARGEGGVSFYSCGQNTARMTDVRVRVIPP